MAQKTRPRRSAKRTVRTGRQVRVELPGPPPTPAEKKKIQEVMGLVELAVLALSRGLAYSKHSYRRRKR